MSLIHDALKKAQQKDRAPLGSGLVAMEDATDTPKKKIPPRTIALSVILVIAIAFFLYMKFTPPSQPGPVNQEQSPAVVATKPAPGDVSALKKRAFDAFKGGDFDGAWTGFSAASEVAPADPEIYNNLGLVAKRRGDLETARRNYEKALGIKPDYPEALNNMAILEMDRGDNTKAAELFESALKISPAYPEANFNLAVLYEKKGDKQKASQYYKRFLEVGGNFPGSTVDSVRDHLMELEQ